MEPLILHEIIEMGASGWAQALVGVALFLNLWYVQKYSKIKLLEMHEVIKKNSDRLDLAEKYLSGSFEEVNGRLKDMDSSRDEARKETNGNAIMYEGRLKALETKVELFTKQN